MGRSCKKSCLVCYQKKNFTEFIQCDNHHHTCNSCLVSWYQQDSSKIGICPECRQTMEIKHLDLKHIEVKVKQDGLSMPIIPIITNPLDHLTQDWLNRFTKPCPNCGIYIEKSTGCNSMICRCGVEFCYKCGNRECECVEKCIRAHLLPLVFLKIFIVVGILLLVYYNLFLNGPKSPSKEFLFIMERCNETWPTSDQVCLAYEKELQRLVRRTIMRKRSSYFDGILENAILKSSWEELQTAYNAKGKNPLEMKRKWLQFKPNCEKDIFYLSNYCTYWNIRFFT